jgi:hypothetical protein
MCVCVCVCVFVCTCACTSLSSSVLLLPPLIAKWHAVPYMCIYIYIHIYIHVCVGGGMRCHLYSLCLCVCVCVCVCVYTTPLQRYLYTHVCTFVGLVGLCVCAYTQYIHNIFQVPDETHTHTHTHTHAPLTTQHFTGARRRQVAAATPGGTHSQKCSQKCLSLVNMQRTYSKVLSKAPTYSKHLKALTF